MRTSPLSNPAAALLITFVWATYCIALPSSAVGLDLSDSDGYVNLTYARLRQPGLRFVYIRSTDGNRVDTRFWQNYDEARGLGLHVGAIHTANPTTEDGAAQARFFVENGGHWTNSGPGETRQLPGAIELVPGPNSVYCRMAASVYQRFIYDFVGTYLAITSRLPIIKTPPWVCDFATSWHSLFAPFPLWTVDWSDRQWPSMPAGWHVWHIWQYGTSAEGFGRLNRFNGAVEDLQDFASNRRLPRLRLALGGCSEEQQGAVACRESPALYVNSPSYGVLIDLSPDVVPHGPGTPRPEPTPGPSGSGGSFSGGHDPSEPFVGH